jgi:predicted PurR-regulated permease PerM
MRVVGEHRAVVARRQQKAGWSRYAFASPDGAVKLALIGLGAVLVWKLASVLLLLFVAVLIATILRGMADALAEKTHAPTRLMLAVVTIVVTLVLLAVAYWIGPRIAREANDFFARLATQLHILQAQFGHTPVGHAVAKRLASPTRLENQASAYVFNIARSTLTTVGELFAVLVLSLYLAEAARMYHDGAVRLFPPAHRALASSVMEEMGHDLRRWLIGQAIDMITVGGLSAIGLYFLGVPVPFALALLAGLLTIVPYFGALAAGVPGVLVALTQSWQAAVWVVLIFLGCHVIEGYIVGPIVQRRMIQMPPAVVLGSMAVAATLFGPLGLILGTPMAVVAMVLVRRVYIEHVLNDRPC